VTVSQSRRARRASLGRSFRSFVAGQTVNGLGTMVATVALPLVAVERLHASVFDVGILEAVEWVPALTIGLPVGALIDRHQHQARVIMMGANLGQAAAVAAVPVTAATGVLTLAVLLAAAFTAGLFGTFFQTGYSPYLRQLVAPDDLATATARLRAGQSAARVSGPALGGALVETVGSATAILADAASFLVSFAALWVTKPLYPAKVPPTRQPIRTEIADGVRYLRTNPRLLTVAVASAAANLFLTAIGAVEIVFLVRSVRVAPGSIGALFAIGGVGGLAGALAAGELTGRFGTDRLARSALAVTAPAALLIPLTAHDTVVLFAAGGFLVSFGIALVSIALTTIGLRECPAELQGRISATSRALSSATIPAGALIGGGLGQLTGTRPALILMSVGYIAFGLALLHSPLRSPTADPQRTKARRPHRPAPIRRPETQTPTTSDERRGTTIRGTPTRRTAVQYVTPAPTQFSIGAPRRRSVVPSSPRAQEPYRPTIGIRQVGQVGERLSQWALKTGLDRSVESGMAVPGASPPLPRWRGSVTAPR